MINKLTLMTVAALGGLVLTTEASTSAETDASFAIETQETRGGVQQRGGGTPPPVRQGDGVRRGDQQRGNTPPAERGGARGGEQRRGQTPPSRDGDAGRGEQQRRGGEAQRDGSRSDEVRRGQQGAERRMRDIESSVSDAEAMRIFGNEIKEHRGRLARAEQLKQIAQRQGNRERMAEIDALIARENQRHNDMLAQGKRILGEARFERIKNAVMNQSRGGSGETPPQRGGGETPPQRGGGETPPQRGGGN